MCDTECPICMEIIDLCKNCSTTECGHQFHSNCLMKSIAYNGFGCPYCRFEMVEDISEDELDDEDDEEYEEGDENQEENEQGEQGEQGEDDDGDDDDDDDDEDEFILNPNEPLPSFELIQKKFIEKGITYESLVKTIMFNSMIYHKNENFQEYQKCNTFMEELFFDVVTKYTPQQEEEVIKTDKNELNFYFLQDDYLQIKYQREMETSLEKFLALDRDNEDENTFLIDTFVNDTIQNDIFHNDTFLNNRFMEVI